VTDPRRGLASASSMSRLASCSGSLAFVAALKESGKYFELNNKDATSGTRIHWWLAVTPFTQRENLEAGKQLDGSEMGTALRCREIQIEKVNAWHGLDDRTVKILIECRLFYRTGLRPRFTGQPDFVIMNDARRALILDFKSGRLESDSAADNLQLRTYVVLLKHEYPELEQIEAAIIEPNVSWESETVRYHYDALAQAEAEILAIVDEAAWNHKRTAGPHCKHCPARVYCPEAQNYVQTAIDFSQSTSLIRDLPRGEAGSSLWAKIGLAEKLLADMKATYHRIMLDDPGALPGYVLPAEGHQRRTVTDPAAFKKALEVDIRPEDIDLLADYPIGKIETKFGEQTGLTGKKLKTEFERLTAGSVTVTRDAPFIRPLSRKERETLIK
jgi:hypothetical protein